MTQLKSFLIKSSLFNSCLLLIIFSSSCKKSVPAHKPSLFSKIDSLQSHIGFINEVKDTDKFSILDYLYFYNGGGVAAGDINNDGLTDLYFISNAGENKLYLNKGKFGFEDITEKAGVAGYADWQTGVTMADVNGDGLLDMYVCAVGNYKGLEGANELYINNGPDADGQVTFTEKAAQYGLDFTGFSTQAAFFDYDKDGDLDMYLLNHAVHTSRSYDQVSARGLQDNEAGDYLFENQLAGNGQTGDKGVITKFKDVSKEAGIYQAAMGYGLGIAVADLNNDGWEDMYVANDFHEDDYYYINNQDGTFTESVKNHFRHLSRFSMGCDIADVNNDGYQDVMTLDMYPEEEQIEKSSAGEDPYDIFLYKLQFGFFYQYSRNCLQLNLSGEKFRDIGLMSGVAATDWSWSTLLADYDNDGIKDIFVANGIVRRPNNLDYVKYALTDSMLYIKQLPKSMTERALSLMPEGKTHPYLFQGTASLRFKDKSAEWGFDTPTISNGAAYADLDNDGDLDLITNNINEKAGIYRNNNEKIIRNHYLQVKLQGNTPNTFGTGAKVILKSKGVMQVQQLMPTRGFLSSVEPALNFGLGKLNTIDTLAVIWGNGKVEVKTNIKVNTTLTLKQSDAGMESSKVYSLFYPKTEPVFEEVTDAVKLDYTHHENSYFDFFREGLIPFKVSTEGPALATGDVNGDGLDDFFVGGAKHQPAKLFIQKENNFVSANEVLMRTDSVYEDVDAAFFDADGDKDLDLYAVSAGNEFYAKMPQQADRLYLNDGGGNFTKSVNGLPAMYDNKSCVKPFDFDKDGDIDLFVGGRVVGYNYGTSPNSYLLINDGKGNFSDQTDKLAPGLRKAGMVTDAVWVDYDKDKDEDLIVVGDWMPIKVFENRQSIFVEMDGQGTTNATGLAHSQGLWQTIAAADFDKDGDIDLMAGNLGTNTKFRKREDSKLKMYVKDIDGNKTTEHILAYSVDNKWYPVAYKDELGKQLPLINKRFTDYKGFAGKTVDEIFSNGELKDAAVFGVQMFESVYLENTGKKKFKIHTLPFEAQVSRIFVFHIEDVDQDGNLDVLLGGNFYGVSTYQGRYDASYGLLLKGNGKGNFKPVLPTENGFLLEGEVRKIKSLKTKEGELLLVARNNQPIQIFRHLKNTVTPARPSTLR